jgi:hypothetical protein
MKGLKNMNKIREFKEMRMGKKGMAITAALITAALLLTGTFAWQQMVSRTNEFIGSNDTPTLHDDFDPAAGVKDVYVENRTARPFFVRVQLAEAMDLTSSTWRPSPADYEAHTHEAAAEDCEHDNAAGKKFHDYFTWTMGGQKYYMPAPVGSGVVDNPTAFDGSENGVRQTPLAEIVTIAEYLAKTDPEKDDFKGWIFDTDGYAYWSQPLLKDDVTGLLLHGVATDAGLKNTDYYYAIDVRVQVVDRLDLPMWQTGAESVDGSHTTYDEATAEGKQLLNWLDKRLDVLLPPTP